MVWLIGAIFMIFRRYGRGPRLVLVYFSVCDSGGNIARGWYTLAGGLSAIRGSACPQLVGAKGGGKRRGVVTAVHSARGRTTMTHKLTEMVASSTM